MKGASGEAVDSGGEFSGVRCAGLFLAGLSKVGFQGLKLRQLGVELGLQGEGLAEPLLVAGQPIGGVLGTSLLLAKIGLEVFQDVLEAGDQPYLRQVGLDADLLVVISAQQHQTGLDLSVESATDVAPQVEAAQGVNQR